jgi:hypothetical protein
VKLGFNMDDLGKFGVLIVGVICGLGGVVTSCFWVGSPELITSSMFASPLALFSYLNLIIYHSRTWALFAKYSFSNWTSYLRLHSTL